MLMSEGKTPLGSFLTGSRCLRNINRLPDPSFFDTRTSKFLHRRVKGYAGPSVYLQTPVLVTDEPSCSRIPLVCPRHYNIIRGGSVLVIFILRGTGKGLMRLEFMKTAVGLPREYSTDSNSLLDCSMFALRKSNSKETRICVLVRF